MIMIMMMTERREDVAKEKQARNIQRQRKEKRKETGAVPVRRGGVVQFTTESEKEGVGNGAGKQVSKHPSNNILARVVS